MKATKFAIAALVAGLVLATGVNASSIGRSGGGGSHSSPSVSRSPSVTHSAPAPAPKAPSVAPAPAKPGGIGGTQGSVGVRKSEVTQPIAQQTAPARVNPDPGKAGSFSAPTTSPNYAPAPGYSAPAPVVVNGGGGFGSSFMGSLGGTIVGNALFGNHGHSGGTTVINNGAAGVPSSGGTFQSSGPSVGSVDSQFNPGGVSVQPKKEYTVWSFIADVFGFVIVIALLVGVAWLFYKGFQMVRNFINKERGVSTHPFNPTQQFWTIQKAFASADVTALQTLLGPDIVDELTNGLAPSTLTLHNVSHEIRLSNNTEFSIWYKFEDDGAEVNQVWHYEKFGKDWKLNGIENV
jgi:hypothetical protein